MITARGARGGYVIQSNEMQNGGKGADLTIIIIIIIICVYLEKREGDKYKKSKPQLINYCTIMEL